jgi:hypothetical protein
MPSEQGETYQGRDIVACRGSQRGLLGRYGWVGDASEAGRCLQALAGGGAGVALRRAWLGGLTGRTWMTSLVKCLFLKGFL